jgi:hypothetical protein
MRDRHFALGRVVTFSWHRNHSDRSWHLIRALANVRRRTTRGATGAGCGGGELTNYDGRTTEGVALSVVAAEMRAIELDALHGGIGCGLGGA